MLRGEVAERVEQLGALLVALGVGPGDLRRGTSSAPRRSNGARVFTQVSTSRHRRDVVRFQGRRDHAFAKACIEKFRAILAPTGPSAAYNWG